MSEDARRAAERAARTSYGRLVAILAGFRGDIASAEDALADAFAAALHSWPGRGVPTNPDAWLLTAARRAAGHARARSKTAHDGSATLSLLADERADAPADGRTFGDERLKLMFVCTHPAIDPAVQAPLMMQTVLGIDAARIAASFLASPAALGQKLVRAKAKIREAGISFTVPEPARSSERIGAVLAAIYAAYGTGWEDIVATDAKRRGLSEEAIWLGQLVIELVPENPEGMGLLALMLHCEARRTARRDASGGFVPLVEQDARRWDGAMAARAEALLRAASAFATPGRFQIEAAIQSLHAQTVLTGVANGRALCCLYDLLVRIAPSIGAQVARACAYGEHGDAPAALAQLVALQARARDYQPWWAARARLLHLLGRNDDAWRAARTAAGLSADPAVRDHLLSGGLFRTGAAASYATWGCTDAAPATTEA